MEHQEERKDAKKSQFQPVDSETIHWLIQNHALSYYQAKNADEKSMILNRIEADCKSREKKYTADEIKAKFKSLRHQFSNSKSELNRGIVKEAKWRYFKEMSQIMDSTIKRRTKKRKPEEIPQLIPEMNIKLEPEILLNEIEKA